MCSLVADHVAGLVVVALGHNNIAQGADQLGFALVVDPLTYQHGHVFMQLRQRLPGALGVVESSSTHQ